MTDAEEPPRRPDDEAVTSVARPAADQGDDEAVTSVVRAAPDAPTQRMPLPSPDAVPARRMPDPPEISDHPERPDGVLVTAPAAPSRRAHRRTFAAAVVTLLVLAVAAVVLATRDSGPSRADSQAAAVRSAQAARERGTRARQAIAGRCRTAMQPLLGELAALDQRLDGGMRYRDYAARVGGARRRYDTVSADRTLASACIASVGLALEGALTQYTRAMNDWGRCLDDPACSTDAVSPDLQAHWAGASDALDAARDGLAALGAEPPSAPVPQTTLPDAGDAI